uniref:Uncharacterized protein n=1 Tax=Oryza sativa subsp. japonica TaxID=39947 RepID=Q5VMQ8_ORYSJ|nr:hypothetical protein [Oryza sativa Japonica Group]
MRAGHRLPRPAPPAAAGLWPACPPPPTAGWDRRGERRRRRKGRVDEERGVEEEGDLRAPSGSIN